MVYEFCAENFTKVPEAIAAGAGRIELCDNLAVGGTTPSSGTIRQTIAYAHARSVPVMCMVRPRGGDFVYSECELQMMEEDAACALGLGADGIVLGCLAGESGSYKVSFPDVERILAAARKGRERPFAVTFHMAFDELAPDEQLRAIDALSGLGVTRILTHGGVAGTAIEDNIAHLQDLIAYAGERLRILPGGGITWQNRDAIARALGADELHGTRIVPLE